jgi:hypothetical protein
MSSPRRLMIYDATCTGRGLMPGLTHSWIAGALLYRALGRLDAWRGVRSWEEGLSFLADHALEHPISEVQFWGHGKWGEARVDGELLDGRSLLRGHEHEPLLRRLRARLTDDALFWFRTCETLGAHKGHTFARDFSDHLGCDVAGHTYIIGPWQSGLHRLARGAEPHWDPAEGIEEGSEDEPERALWSGPRAPNTITCLHGEVPVGF